MRTKYLTLSLIMLSSYCLAQENIKLVIDPPALSFRYGYERIQVMVVNNSKAPINILKPNDIFSYTTNRTNFLGINEPYIVNFNKTNTCQYKKSYLNLISNYHIVTVNPGETKKIDEVNCYGMFDCLKADSSYNFTLTYHPIVKLHNLSPTDLEKIETLKKRLRSIETRLYNLGVSFESASTQYNITQLYEYIENDQVLSKITPLNIIQRHYCNKEKVADAQINNNWCYAFQCCNFLQSGNSV